MRIVDDTTTDGWAVAGVVIGAVLSAASLLLAGWALKVGRSARDEALKARLAVANERRRTFELEILRELSVALDGDVLNRELMLNQPTRVRQHFRSRLDALPGSALPTWRKVAGAENYVEVAGILGMQLQGDGTGDDFHAVQIQLQEAMYDEVIAEIRRRRDERDD